MRQVTKQTHDVISLLDCSFNISRFHIFGDAGVWDVRTVEACNMSNGNSIGLIKIFLNEAFK